METTATATAKTLRRQLILPLRAVRAGLGETSGAATQTAALVQQQVIPILGTAADQVTALRRRVEDSVTRMERPGETPTAKRHRAKALAQALAAVDGAHQDLTTAIGSLDR